MSSLGSLVFRQRALLGITAAIATGQAVLGLLAPRLLASLFGYEEDGVVLIELRAFYGGFMAGVAVLLWLAVVWPRLRPGALMLLLCGSAGAAAGRVFGMLETDAWSPVIVLLAIYEIAVAIVAAVVMVRPHGREPAQTEAEGAG